MLPDLDKYRGPPLEELGRIEPTASDLPCRSGMG